MRIGKRLLALLCMGALLLSLSQGALAAAPDTYTLTKAGTTERQVTATGSGLECAVTINPDGTTGTLTFVRYVPACSTLIIPETIDVKDGDVTTKVTITALGDRIFRLGQYRFPTLTIPKTVTSISNQFMAGISGKEEPITAVLVDEGNPTYKSVDGVVFSKDGTTLVYFPLDKAGSYTVPNGVTTIGSYAFYGAQKLTDVGYPDGLLTIENSGMALTGITTLNLPDTVTTLGNGAFYANYKLTNIDLPDSVTSIGTGLFSDCSSITTAILAMPTIPNGFLNNCDALTSLTLSDGVEIIGEESFRSCDKLTTVTLPSTVTTIGRSAFASSDKLASVTFNSGLTTIGEEAFQNAGLSGALSLPDSVETLGQHAFSGTKITAIDSYGGVTALPNQAFSGCKALTQVTIPAAIKTMGSSAFSGCVNLQSVVIAPGGITAIPDYAFWFNSTVDTETSHLTSVDIPDTVTSIGSSAFASNYALTEITLPENLTTLGRAAFSGCRGLLSIVIPDGVTRLEDDTFEHCWMLNSITLPADLEEVGIGVFNKCDALQSLTFPSTLKDLGLYHSLQGGSDLYSDAFGYTPELTSITFLGDKPTTSERPFALKPSEGHNEKLTIYYPDGNTTYDFWKAWTYPKVVAGEKPPVTTVATQTALSAVLEQTRQNKLVLWFNVVVSHDPNGDLIPSGNLQYFINNKQVFPNYGMGSSTPLHKIVGLEIDNLENQEITVQVKLLASEGFLPSESAVISGKAVRPQWDQQIPLVPGGPGSITPEGQYVTADDGAGGFIITGINKPTADGTDITLPATLDGKLVTGLGANLFTGNKFVSYVTVPKGVKTLGAGVFKDCINLRILSLPSGITALPADTFSGCAALSGVNIPDTVTTIGTNAFKDCAKLYSLTFPSSVDTLDKDAFSGVSLKAVEFEGSAPGFIGGMSTAFGPNTILYTEKDAKGFDVSPWTEMRREPVKLGLDFTAAYDASTKSMLVAVTFDTTAFGDNPPPADLSKVTVWIYNKQVTTGVEVKDGKIVVLVPSEYDGQDAFVNVRYPGDWYYKEAISKSKSEILPFTKGDLTITTAKAEAKISMDVTITLTVTPTFTDNLPYQHAYKPDLSKLVVTLAGQPVTDFIVDKDTRSISMDVTGLKGQTVALTLAHPGDYHFNPAATYTSSVVIPELPKPPAPDPVTNLTATAGSITKAGGVCTLPVTATLSITNPGEGTVDRSKLSVTLDGKAATWAAGAGDILNVDIPADLLGRTVPVAVSYAGQSEYGYPAKAVSLGSLKLADPSPAKADTTLTATAGAVVWYFATSTPTTSTYGLTLAPALTHNPYTGDQGLTPNRTEITVTMDGAPVSAAAFRWVSDTLYVDIPAAKLNTKTTIVLTYPGDSYFNSSTRTISNVSLAYGTPTPPPTGDNGGGGGGGGSAPAPKPEPGTDAKVTVSDKAVTEAVKSAAESGSVILKADAPADAKSVAVTVPASVMKAVAKAEAPVSLQTPVADLKLDVKVLETLQANGAKDVIVSAGAADSAALPKAAQEALAGRPVYDISITAGGKSVSQFGGGTVTVAFPYTPAPGEDSSALVACWVKDDGTTEVLRSSSYKDGKLTFSTPHLSTYAILHKNIAFVDVTEDNWAKADIGFAASRGILNGMGDNLFGPGIALTGSMAVAALARMDGVQDGAPGADWAAPALAWAEEKDLLPEGFGPDAVMTREQFAYLVAGFMGGAEKVNTPGYVDVTRISLPCLDSVNYLTSMGIMQGTGDGCFSPQSFLTRSELAAILHRLVDWQIG